MRELERDAADTHLELPARPGLPSIGIVGGGRLGTALARALSAAGHPVEGPLGRGESPSSDVVVLCVPDEEIPRAAAALSGSVAIVGHTSGATPLAALAPAGAAAGTFGLHPLQTFAARDGARGPDRFRGAGCAIAGSTPAALGTARELARAVGMEPFELADRDRAAYHAAASIASNFVVTVQAAAEAVASAAGLDAASARRALAPLVRATVENWERLGPRDALTGPVARGDEATIALQRAAIERDSPELLELFDALLERTRALAALDSPVGAAA